MFKQQRRIVCWFGNVVFVFVVGVVLIIISSLTVTNGIPSKPYYFNKQLIDHFDNNKRANSTSTNYYNNNKYWTQRYYQSDTYYYNPPNKNATTTPTVKTTTTTVNSPVIIFLIFGGESAIEPQTGLLYPFITEYLARDYNAFVVQPEHRFYGTSQPISRIDIDTAHINNQTDPRIQLLSYEQALYDAIRLLQYIVTTNSTKSNRFNCILDRTEYIEYMKNRTNDSTTTTKTYCRVISVGGSYSGFLSAMSRIVFPTIIDISYAASAPMKFYTQDNNLSMYEYYNHITSVTETIKPGCSYAVQSTLYHVQDTILRKETKKYNTTDVVSKKLSVCNGTVPQYVGNNISLLVQEIMMMVGYTFANANMAYYPPETETTQNTTALVQACNTFLSFHICPIKRLRQFLIDSFNTGSCVRTNKNNNNNTCTCQDDHDDDCCNRLSKSTSTSSTSTTSSLCNTCFNMTQQLPAGINSSISGGDWSGVGTGISGDSWDFQTCTTLIERIGFGPQSMFPIRTWTMEWLQQHCSKRYIGVQPTPYELNTKYHVNELFNITSTTTTDNNNDDNNNGPTNNNDNNKINNHTTSYILFTNGLRDGWSVSGIQNNISETIVSLNFPNGAHHSDLTHIGPTKYDTIDIQYGFQQIRTILSKWLNETIINEVTMVPSMIDCCNNNNNNNNNMMEW